MLCHVYIVSTLMGATLLGAFQKHFGAHCIDALREAPEHADCFHFFICVVCVDLILLTHAKWILKFWATNCYFPRCARILYKVIYLVRW